MFSQLNRRMASAKGLWLKQSLHEEFYIYDIHSCFGESLTQGNILFLED